MSDEPNHEDFLAYVGPADLHDATVTAVERIGDDVRVHVRSYVGRAFVLEFFGVAGIHAVRPVGMMLYALTELKTTPPLRRFVFANWDDDSDATIEIVAEGFRCGGSQ